MSFGVTFRVLTIACGMVGCIWALPVQAQPVDNIPMATGGSGTMGYQNQFNTGSQTQNSQSQAAAPTLQATTAAPLMTAADVTEISGLNTAGTVRVNNLANNEALLNIIANGLEIIGLAWGAHFGILGFMHMSAGDPEAKKKILWAFCGTAGGLAAPGIINWLVASSRDANLFS